MISPRSSSKIIKRLHDTIYYEEKSIQNTKESFKQLYKILDPKKFTSNLKILDVGCGNGNLIFYLNKKIPNAQITGVDIDKKLLGIVKKNTSKKNKLIKYNIIKKNQKKIDKFDIIISAGVLAIFDNPEIFFQNIKKNLKKNGVIYLFGNFTYYPFNIYTKA